MKARRLFVSLNSRPRVIKKKKVTEVSPAVMDEMSRFERSVTWRELGVSGCLEKESRLSVEGEFGS